MSVNTEKSPIELATPVYSINSIESYPLNPYRLLVHYIVNDAYHKLSEKYNISLKDFYEKYDETKRKDFMNSAIEKLGLKDLSIKYVAKPEHEKIFLEFRFYRENTELGHFIFYTHTSYISPTKYSSREYAAAELDFTGYNCFDFLSMDQSNNIFDFAKSDETLESMNMILASIYAFYNFTDFVKFFKTKMLAVKNIQMFCEKLIDPIVTALQLTFTPEQFMIGVLCGDKIFKEVYSYDNYLKTVKDFEAFIREKFSETYAKAKEDSSTE